MEENVFQKRLEGPIGTRRQRDGDTGHVGSTMSDGAINGQMNR